jgi:hypothetical protein
VERLTLDGVFVTVRDGEGQVLFRTVDLTPGGITRSPTGDERSKAENRPAARLNFLREVGVTCTLYL